MGFVVLRSSPAGAGACCRGFFFVCCAFASGVLHCLQPSRVRWGHPSPRLGPSRAKILSPAYADLDYIYRVNL